MEDGTKHWIVTYRGIKTTIPRHPSKEIRTGTFHGIIKKLGIRLK
jgi:mRNA interferase HicA